jgi:methylmalonyl-CoA/ethylmalonyl-CoA epimerase
MSIALRPPLYHGRDRPQDAAAPGAPVRATLAPYNTENSMEFDHIGVVVRELERGKQQMSEILGIEHWTEPLEDPLQKVYACFGADRSGVRFELLTPTGPGSPLARVLSDGVNILNHIAYRVPDLQASAELLRAQRCAPVGPAQPGIAYDNKPIQFFLTPLRLLLELIER